MHRPNLALLLVFTIGAYNGLLHIAQSGYQCQPYLPTADCEVGKYEVRVLSALDASGRTEVAVVQSECILAVNAEEVLLKNSLWNDMFYPKLTILRSQVKVCRWVAVP